MSDNNTSSNVTNPTFAYLKNACAVRGITLLELAERSNVPYTTLIKWASKEPKTMETLRRLKKTLSETPAVKAKLLIQTGDGC